MLTDLEPPPAPTRFWSWKKMTAWFLGILTVFITALLLYDEKLEPYDDLKPTRTEVPDIRTNGYLMLKAAWGKLPLVDSKSPTKWSEIEDGRLPWDDGFVARLNPSNRDLGKDLMQALAAPGWQVPFSKPAFTKTPFIKVILRSDTLYYKGFAGFLAMEAEAWQQQRAGNPTAVVELIRHLRLLSLRQIRGSNCGMDLWAGFHYDEMAARITCGFITETIQREATLLQLASCWAEDQLTQADLFNPVAGEAELLTTYIRKREYLEEDGHLGEINDGWKLFYRCLTKPNAVENRLNRVLSVLQNRGMATSSTLETSGLGAVNRLIPQHVSGLSWLNANVAGLELTRQVVSSPVSQFATFPRRYLFRARAVRLAVAIKRWQLNQKGAVPMTLTELVPDYLATIPSDPWNGQSLRWSAADQIVYAVGPDWKPDLPVFSLAHREWINEGSDSPGLRLTRPAPPPPPPAPAPKKSPKPAAKATLPPGKP
jgi:hypothetical protein